jgi:predicted transcriptional regulator of viral defense system
MVSQTIHVKYNAAMKTRLGRQETQMLAYLQLRRHQTVRAGELTGPLRLTPAQELELFRRMLRGELIARVRPGLFLVPERLPLGGAWTPSETLALNALMADRGGRYQICGPNAFNRYGLDEQMPNRVYAYNTRISGVRSIGTVTLMLIKVAEARLGGTEIVRSRDGEEAIWSSRVRTLVDAVYDWTRFAGLPRGFEWIRKELAARRVTGRQLVATALRFGDRATIRRIGWVLEREGVPARVTRPLREALPASSGLIALNPMAPKRGQADRRWGVVVNGGV